MGLGEMWFGTEGRMRWIPAPLAGADVSPQGWGSTGTLLGGGGFAFGSFGSHKNYQYGWSAASKAQAASIMQSYASGTYGAGLLYFIDPFTYRRNILPAHWADPSLALRGMPPLIRTYNVTLTGTPTAVWATNDLPTQSVTYDLALTVAGFPGHANSLFIPVPPGRKLALGAIYTRTGSGGVYAAPVDAIGRAGAPQLLTEVSQTATEIAPDIIESGALGVRLWIGKSATGAGTVTLTALTARIIDGAVAGGTGYGEGGYGVVPFGGGATIPVGISGPWVAGEGHSGCRFDGRPTYIEHGGWSGDQAEYAVSLKEVGDWMVATNIATIADLIRT